MAKKITNKDTMIIPGWIIMPYKYSVGALASRFFKELRDNKKIIGVKCSECNRVIVPPISVCDKCYRKLDKCVELNGKGTLLTYTIVYYQPPCEWLKPPLVYGLIKLDGADTGFMHLLGEINLDKIEIGMRLEAVFKDKRQGDILDIKYFR